MLHLIVLKVRRTDTAGSMPEWAGVGLHLAGLAASGWMTIGALSVGAWVPGLVGGVIFVPALFMLTGYLFPEDRRRDY